MAGALAIVGVVASCQHSTARGGSASTGLLASASSDKTVRLWNPTTGEQLQKLEGHNGWVRAVAFSLNGQLLASALPPELDFVVSQLPSLSLQ
jgi:WD40 repeat protein